MEWTTFVGAGRDSALVVTTADLLQWCIDGVFKVGQFCDAVCIVIWVWTVVTSMIFCYVVLFGTSEGGGRGWSPQLCSDQSLGQVGIGSVGQSGGAFEESPQYGYVRLYGGPVFVYYLEGFPTVGTVSGHECGFPLFHFL